MLSEHLQPPPGQVLQLMPAPRQVAHQMAVEARRLQQQAPHMRVCPAVLVCIEGLSRSPAEPLASLGQSMQGLQDSLMVQPEDIKPAQTAPEAAPLHSKQSHCHDLSP